MVRHGKVESFFGTESRDQYCFWQQLGFNGTLVNKQKEKNRIVADDCAWLLQKNTFLV